jgi:hypothetical protein
LLDFYQNRNFLTNFNKNPKYEISRKICLEGVVLVHSDIRAGGRGRRGRHDNDSIRFSVLLFKRPQKGSIYLPARYFFGAGINIPLLVKLTLNISYEI